MAPYTFTHVSVYLLLFALSHNFLRRSLFLRRFKFLIKFIHISMCEYRFIEIDVEICI